MNVEHQNVLVSDFQASSTPPYGLLYLLINVWYNITKEWNDCYQNNENIKVKSAVNTVLTDCAAVEKIGKWRSGFRLEDDNVKELFSALNLEEESQLVRRRLTLKLLWTILARMAMRVVVLTFKDNVDAKRGQFMENLNAYKFSI